MVWVWTLMVDWFSGVGEGLGFGVGVGVGVCMGLVVGSLAAEELEAL